MNTNYNSTGAMMNRGLSKTLAVIGIACAALAFVLPMVAFVVPQAGSKTLGLVVVKPSLANLPDEGGKVPDGPSVFIGPLASCSKDKDEGDFSCTIQSMLNVTYDTSKLPDNSLKIVLSTPSPAVAAAIATSLAVTGLFWLLYTGVVFRTIYGKGPMAMNGPGMQSACAWIGFLGFMAGVASYLFLLIWWSKSIGDINRSISSQGRKGPRLAAELGHAWIFVACGYGAYLVPLLVAAMKMETNASSFSAGMGGMMDGMLPPFGGSGPLPPLGGPDMLPPLGGSKYVY